MPLVCLPAQKILATALAVRGLPGAGIAATTTTIITTTTGTTGSGWALVRE